MHVKGMLRPWFSGRIKSLRSNEKLKVKNSKLRPNSLKGISLEEGEYLGFYPLKGMNMYPFFEF